MTPAATPASLLSRSPLARRDFLRLTGLIGGGLAVGGLVSACGGDPGSSAASGGGGAVGTGKTIGLSLNGNNAYSSYVAEGVLKALEGTEYSFAGVQNDFDSSTELGNVQNLLSQGIAGLVVLPADATTIARAAQLAAQQDVPVGNALWPGESDADEYYAGVADLDSVEGGTMIGEWLIANATPGPVIVVQGIVGQGFSERIDEGLDAALEGSGFEVVIREQGFFARDTATSIVESGLQANPGVTAIVAYSASMSNGISAYLEANGLTGIAHVSSDADDEMFTWLETPYLSATRYYSAAQTGLLAAQAVRAALEGGEVTFDNVVEQSMVTAEDAAAAIEANPYRYEQFADQASI
ncbi:sugar ABC transporter substrate-binding protein [Modestobacter sp. Leaf380]|uniref:sugar ABC transporter substrate-binding protein n=1 Tax=Modestobacter sp. Leaf380 TaxID=1736356 RepID=UPI001F43A0B4|nr:sugar ABC transporter substrate-binding protein [Modestobacter sp. Leaf380]